MTNTEFLIEKSIISTVLFSHHSCKDEDFFNSVELQEEWFSDYFHKLVVKAINHNKSLGLSTSEDFIAERMAEFGTLNYNQWIDLISANPFSSILFNVYLDELKGSKKSLIGSI